MQVSVPTGGSWYVAVCPSVVTSRVATAPLPALLESIDSKMSELTNALNKLMRVTTFLAEGETEYPTLVMITPAQHDEADPSLSKRLARAFSADAWLSDEVHVYFLDALDYRPLDPPLVLKDAKPWVRKAAPRCS